MHVCVPSLRETDTPVPVLDGQQGAPRALACRKLEALTGFLQANLSFQILCFQRTRGFPEHPTLGDLRCCKRWFWWHWP